MTRTTETLRLIEYRRVTETDDNDDPRPSFKEPAASVIDIDGVTTSECVRPLRKATPRNVIAFPTKRKVG